jgi:hypothetical protein
MIKRDWRKDPAYKFLFIAIGIVLLASILFMMIAGASLNSFFQPNGGGNGQTAPGGLAQGTVSTQSTPSTKPSPVTSTSPTSVPTTVPSPTVTANPSPSPTVQPSPSPTPNPSPTQAGQGQLTAQIVNPPTQVMDNTVVFINVATGQPNTTVKLTIITNASPVYIALGPQQTDGNGNVAFQWPVQYRAFSRNPVNANLVATATNQNGQQASSQVATVRVIVHNIFPIVPRG